MMMSFSYESQNDLMIFIPSLSLTHSIIAYIGFCGSTSISVCMAMIIIIIMVALELDSYKFVKLVATSYVHLSILCSVPACLCSSNLWERLLFALGNDYCRLVEFQLKFYYMPVSLHSHVQNAFTSQSSDMALKL